MQKMLRVKKQAIVFLGTLIVVNEDFILVNYALLHMGHAAAMICCFCSEANLLPCQQI